MLYQPVSQWHSLHVELLIELVAQKLTELWRFKNLAYFLTWWPSSMTYLFVNVTYWNCSPIPYVDQVWWWYVKAFMSYAWQNWQTDRQMKGQSEIAYLPKFPKFDIVIMILPIIMTHLRIYALLYHVSWYHCSIQELRKKNSKSYCDVIVDDINIIRMVFDIMRYIVYDSAVKLKLWSHPIWPPNAVLEYV